MAGDPAWPGAGQTVMRPLTAKEKSAPRQLTPAGYRHACSSCSSCSTRVTSSPLVSTPVHFAMQLEIKALHRIAAFYRRFRSPWLSTPKAEVLGSNPSECAMKNPR